MSQNWQTASARSSSRPVHRLHPANRAEHRRSSGVGSFALKGVEDFLDGVAHSPVGRGILDPILPEALQAEKAGVTVSACQSLGRRIVAAASQAIVDSECQAGGDDLCFRELDQRVWMRSGVSPRTPARVARLAIRSKAAMYSGRQSG